MNVIELLKLQRELASTEHYLDQVNRELASRPGDPVMTQTRQLLSETALELRQRLNAVTKTSRIICS